MAEIPERWDGMVRTQKTEMYSRTVAIKFYSTAAFVSSLLSKNGISASKCWANFLGKLFYAI